MSEVLMMVSLLLPFFALMIYDEERQKRKRMRTRLGALEGELRRVRMIERDVLNGSYQSSPRSPQELRDEVVRIEGLIARHQRKLKLEVTA